MAFITRLQFYSNIYIFERKDKGKKAGKKARIYFPCLCNIKFFIYFYLFMFLFMLVDKLQQ